MAKRWGCLSWSILPPWAGPLSILRWGTWHLLRRPGGCPARALGPWAGDVYFPDYPRERGGWLAAELGADLLGAGETLDQEAQVSNETGWRPGKAIVVAAVITLGVTLLRLVGELLAWPTVLFSRSAGGGGAVIGIVWLVPVFGIYFAAKLFGAGERPQSLGRAFGLLILAILVLPAFGLAAMAIGMKERDAGVLVVYSVASVVAVWVGIKAWPALGKLLALYGLAARVPVAVVMLFAILGNWGTHYDVAPPGFPGMAPLVKWLLIGVFPQLTVWIAFTVAIGGLFGVGTVAIMTRRKPAAGTTGR
jgi:hypothetical protein